MKSQKVLIVDDEKTNLKILSDILKDEVEVIMAKDGRQGIDKAIQFKPDLILLDIIMPGMDGFAVIKQLKSNPMTNNIPIIFVTGELDVVKEERGLKLGACDYIQKPFHVAILKCRVRFHLQLARQQKMLEQMANIDPLTGIANRRRYDEVLKTEWLSSIREETMLCLVMIDIDHFKNYNDHYGHALGDWALQKVAATLSQNLRRPRDFIARYGGEEFIAILPQTSRQGALAIVESCRKAIESLQIAHSNSAGYPWLTISIGGVGFIPDSDSSRSALLKIADDMLYEAKRQGRNRVVWHETSEVET
ncbi:MAG: diguanylate cyclase (GGDEF)-like protein [Alteromonadaceae bacterium]|jgi:diguanylate cyclase (GGDEF)-like protein